MFAFGDRMLCNTEDRLQCIELFRNVRSCYLIDKPLYYYRPNEGSVTSRPYRFSYFEDFIFVETQVELLLGQLVNEREGRAKFLSTTAARHLQRLHDSYDERAVRLSCYRFARELCVKSGLFPEKSAPVRRDCGWPIWFARFASWIEKTGEISFQSYSSIMYQRMYSLHDYKKNSCNYIAWLLQLWE